ncbi:CBL-interacting serine/threonine-protein kinase 7 [Asimina triloba]
MEPVNPPKSPEEVKLLLGKYELGRLLGRGTFAKVFYARSAADDTSVAIKVMDKVKISKMAAMEPRIVREVTAMRRLRHPNVIKLHEVMATKSKIYLVMEYAKGGDLFSKISRRRPLKEGPARHYFQQLVTALRYCHSNGVAHRDIKPQNLLLDHDGRLKVSDFGLSALPEQLKDGLLHTACGTPVFAAPEVVTRKGYDGARADAWSCGVILFLLLAGYLPFDDSNIVLMHRKMVRREFEFPAWFSRPVKQVIVRLLDPNPATRMTMDGLEEVGWFKKIHRSDSLEVGWPNDEIDGCKPSMALSMNAFDIISLSSGLDLSGLFEVERKREKRFVSTESAEKIVERIEENGGKQGYGVEWRKGGRLRLVKGHVVVTAEVEVIAPFLALGELEVSASNGMEFDELFWEDWKTCLRDLVLAWLNEGNEDG